jgi:hypothetical protein
MVRKTREQVWRSWPWARGGALVSRGETDGSGGPADPRLVTQRADQLERPTRPASWPRRRDCPGRDAVGSVAPIGVAAVRLGSLARRKR